MKRFLLTQVLLLVTLLSFAASLTIEPQPKGVQTCSDIPLIVQMTVSVVPSAFLSPSALQPPFVH